MGMLRLVKKLRMETRSHLRHHRAVALANGFKKPEISDIVKCKKSTIHGFEWIGDERFLRQFILRPLFRIIRLF